MTQHEALPMVGAGAVWDVGSAIPFRGSNIAGRIAEWGAGIVDAVRASARSSLRRSEPNRQYYHPRRETYLEDAAMSREMYRL